MKINLDTWNSFGDLTRLDITVNEKLPAGKKKFTDNNNSNHNNRNTWAILLLRYSRPFLKWTKEELEQTDQRTRVLHTRDNFDILYASRK